MFSFSNPTLLRQVVWREPTIINMADKRKLPSPVPEQGVKYAGAACFQGYHSRPFETTERVRAFSARSGTLNKNVSNTPQDYTSATLGLHQSSVTLGLHQSSVTLGLHQSSVALGLHQSSVTLGLHQSSVTLGLHQSSVTLGLHQSSVTLGLHQLTQSLHWS
jgi:hypothetical protein